MQAAETAITHDHHLSTGHSMRLDPRDDGLQRITDLGRHAGRGHRGGQVPAQIGRRVPEHAVGLSHRAGQTVAVGAEFHRIGARLDHRNQRSIADLLAQAIQGSGNRRRMVSEVVIDGHALHLGDLLHAPLHALEAGKPGNRHLRHHPHMAGGGHRGQGVGDVVLAGQRPLDHAQQGLIEVHLETRAVLAEQTRLPLAAGACGLHRCPAAHADHPRQRLFSLGMDNQAIPRHGAYQVVELPLDGGQIGEDIRVVEFQVVEDGRARAVVDELAALVEEGAVVLVGLDHEERRAAQPCRYTEVLRHAADQKARTHAGMLQHPGQHAGGGGLAVGAGHAQHPAALQHMVGQPLRAGHIGQALIEYVLHRRVAATQGIADHHQIRRGLQVRRLIALHQFDTLSFELGAHGRVDIGVGAGDTVTEFFGQHRQRPHEGAADAENMDMHECPRRAGRRGPRCSRQVITGAAVKDASTL